MSVISYPIPLYQNVRINDQYYAPNYFIITDISQAKKAVITTSVSHNYVIGQQVRLLIPSTGGMRQVNSQTAFVEAIPATNQVTINIDTRFFDAFIDTGDAPRSQILAIGDVNSGAINTSNQTMSTTVPGSFMNISPN